MEKGVYDALQKKYLRTLLFCVCKGVEGSVIEEYASKKFSLEPKTQKCARAKECSLEPTTQTLRSATRSTLERQTSRSSEEQTRPLERRKLARAKKCSSQVQNQMQSLARAKPLWLDPPDTNSTLARATNSSLKRRKEQIGPKCRRFFNLSNFMKFEKDESGRIAILPFFLYVMRTGSDELNK
ncbi:unnamed protein product [Camellia sinensis]